MKIILIGYRGTGKSDVGRRLSKRLNMECISMDGKIVENAGMSIPEIVRKYGWPKFRDMESDLARELAKLDNIIIDTGGGIIERPENTDVLKQESLIVWLKASVNTIVKRIQGNLDRPALVEGKTFTEEVAEVLERRTPKYNDASHFSIDTDSLTSAQVADKIIEFWNKNYIDK